MAAEPSRDLPDECWTMIFKKLHHESDLESTSLVCQRFLSITNSIRVSITFFCLSVQEISRLLQRFNNLKKIQLPNFKGNLNEAVLEIAQSGLDLFELDLSGNQSLRKVGFEELSSKMQNLKVLNCSGWLGDDDLISIADSFPQLEEIQIGCSGETDCDGETIALTDVGIDYLSSKLKRLRKINFSHNDCITDKSLVSLSSNCGFLEHITVFYCGVTEKGFSFLINHSHHLKTLHLGSHFEINSFGVESSTRFPANLQTLLFTRVGISDEFLYSIAKARIPLTSLSIVFCKSYTFAGISRLLQSLQSLKSLALMGAMFLTNKNIEYLSPFLQSLTSLSLYESLDLSDSALAMLTQRLPSLSHLQMSRTSLGKEEYNYDGLKKNFAIKYLDLSRNSYLSTASLKGILSICPSVEKINLSDCFQCDNQLEVADILECNRGLVNLNLSQSELKISRKDAEISELERLDVQYSGITDEVLAMLVRICPGLVHLNLADCENLTEEGIKEVIKSCKRLRYLSLSACEKVDTGIIAWIVTNCPSLRQLVSPSYLYPDEEEKKHFLQQGCLVSQGAHYEI